MECNKEEAVRAMQLSETKMQSKDFTGALKMAQKAQRLFPQLENISQLLTVCEVHCSAENKIGESDMDWYGILQIQQLDNAATIKKQYRKLALLLHPDKNKFAGAETAFKMIGEANRVLADKEKRSVYDMICRAHQRSGVPKLSAHHSTVVKKHTDASSNSQNMQSQSQPNTFSTICPSCLSKFQCCRSFLYRLLCCRQCQRPFKATELRESVHSESLRNQSLNHKGNPSQGPSNSAPQSNGGMEKGNVTRSQNGDATFKPVSKVGISANVSQASNVETKGTEEKSESRVELGKQGVEMSESDPVKSNDSGTSKNKKKRSGNSTSESSERLKTGHASEGKVDNPSDLNGGHHLRRSPRNKQNRPSNLKDDDDVDDVDDDNFVNPPKRLKKGQLSSAAEKEKKDAAADVRSSKIDMSTNSAATVGGQKKEARPKTSFPTDESLPCKRSKTREFELKVMGDTMADKDERNFRTDISPGPNFNVASPPKTITPDPQFHQFDLDVNKLGKVFRANQTWALYDDADIMPRFYAIVKKVFTPGFKVKIKWLETNPDEQGEIDWCEAELPTACGKFKLGGTEEITDHLMFSHQMPCIKASSGRSSFLVYPSEGETWAIYQNWDIGWSCEPEKHKPYNYEFVEVLSDFIENVGVRVAYLGKIKGFVSLFQRSEQHGVSVFQVPPHELYRFSHRIPSFKMTGSEGYGVPQGSFEFDPASLPTDIFDSVGDLKMDNRNKKIEINGLTCEFVERVGSVSGLTDMQKEKNISEREPLISRSPKSKVNQGNTAQPKGSAIPCQGDNKMKTPEKHQKSDLDRGASSLRRSPRDLSKNNSIENVAVKRPDPADDESHVNLTQSEMNSSRCNDSMHASVKDHHSLNLMKNPRASPSSSPDCRLSQTQFYDFKQHKSWEKFRLGQIWALYSAENGFPTTYALVKRIVARPNFRLDMALLEPCSEPTSMSEPVSCGTFNVKDGPGKFFPITLFSHCVNAKFVETDKVEIKPRKGEVWALCKNPDPKLTGPNRAKDMYEIVQVLEDNDQITEVVVLVEVKGLKSIYKAPKIQRSKAGVIHIPRAELHRFSHQIPAFQHTWESDKRLSGCWELDELSIPGTVISLD